ncbi:MAG: dTMP kinase [Pseudomonadota bacterium]
MDNILKFPLFITFEGVEGSGKSTIIKKISKFLSDNSIKNTLTLEPGGTPLGDLIREILLKKEEVAIGSKAELMLFLASRVQHIEEKIIPSLNNGITVLCDRYHDSSLVYQGIARNLGFSFVEKMNKEATGDYKPVLTFLLDVDAEEGLKRISTRKELDRLDKAGTEFHLKVRDGFLAQAKAEPERIHVVDTTFGIQDTVDRVIELLKKLTDLGEHLNAIIK